MPVQIAKGNEGGGNAPSARDYSAKDTPIASML